LKFHICQTLAQVEEAVKQIPEVVAIDTEFVKGNPRTTRLLAIIIADSEQAWYFPWYIADETCIDNHKYWDTIRDIIESRKAIFLQDYNHCDTIILYKHGIDIRDKQVYNLIDMHHLIDENANHSLDTRVKEVFNDPYKEIFWGKYQNYEDAPESEATEYACKDAIYTYRLGVKDLQQVPTDLYQHVKSLGRSLLETELNGLKVNLRLIQETKDSLDTEIQAYLPKLKEEFYEQTEIWELQEWAKEISKRKSNDGRLRVQRPVFNFDSDKQIAWLVYEALKCPALVKTKTGNPSTNSEALLALSESRPALKTLCQYKETKAIYNTFVEGMLTRVENNRIYPHFNVSGTATGRLSHSDPNMGNLPKTGVIRNFFIPDVEMAIIGADYSQLEVVIEANLTNDPNLIRILTEGASKHDITAEGLGIDRNQAKTLNFALQYGAGAGKVGKILGVSKHEAEDIFRRYWELYSGINALKEKVNEEIERTGQITNLAGRTRHFPRPRDKYEMYRQQRQAYNFLIQGVAAECCNRAFYRYGKGLFSVHDEIVAQVPIADAETEKARLIQVMENISKDFNFKYSLKAVAYGPFDCWKKT